MERAVRNAACRFMRSNSSTGRSCGWDDVVVFVESRMEESVLRDDRVGVLLERKSRSRRLRAPFVGVSIEGGDCVFEIGFWGVCGTCCKEFGLDRERGLMFLSLIAAERNAAAALSSSSLSSNFLFRSVVECFSNLVTVMASI